jgi:integrase
MGHIYQRGSIYWIKYYRNGKPYQESTHTDQETEAEKLLKIREGEIAHGGIPGIYYDRVRFDEIAEDFFTDYEVNQKKSLPKVRIYVKHLRDFFGNVRVTEITTAKIKQYMKKRMEIRKKPATINCELSALSYMFTLAKRSRKVGEVPYIPKLNVDNVRTGFFEHDQFLALRDALPNYIKPVVTFVYYTGWRKSEIFNLTWDKVNLREAVIRLNPGETKNKKGREIYLVGELLDLIRSLHSQRNLGCPYVFHHNGKRIKNIYKTWNPTCAKIGLKGKFLHDFRRTAVRNLLRSGVIETVAMKITGHKTRNVFDRYNIVSEGDLKEAAMKHQAFVNALSLPEEREGEGKKIIPLRTVTDTVTMAIKAQ